MILDSLDILLSCLLPYSTLTYVLLSCSFPLVPSWAVTDAYAVNFDSPKALRGLDETTMPRISDKNVDGVAFLFRTLQEAKDRVRGGGSAFLVGRPLAGSEKVYGKRLSLAYLVSNKHVVFRDSACVASVNRRDGGRPDIWDLDQNAWYDHPGGDDLVATCINPHFNRAVHRVSFIPEERFVTPKVVAEFRIGIGDECFMIGRFYNHQGGRTNRPALRLGSISMMQEPIWVYDYDRSRLQESFAVEMRSKEGFSGSPVALWRKPWTWLAEEDLPEDKMDFWGLLGVNWGYIYDEKKENTWLNGVVPAWKISEVLDRPELKAIHATHEAAIQKHGGGEAAKSSYHEEMMSDTGDAVPHQERFNRVLGEAVKPPKSSG